MFPFRRLVVVSIRSCFVSCSPFILFAGILFCWGLRQYSLVFCIGSLDSSLAIGRRDCERLRQLMITGVLDLKAVKAIQRYR